MNSTQNDKQVTVMDHLPPLLGRAAIDVALASFPLALAFINFTASVTGKYISLRNEEQVATLLQNLKERLDNLEAKQKINKEKLKINAGYQEAAHKRLSAVSALDSDDDLALCAGLVAICGTLTGDNSVDKHLLRALGEISPDEVRLFLLVDKTQRKFELKKSQFTHDEKRDAQIEVELRNELASEFFNAAENLLGLSSFTHIISRIHSFGLIEAPTSGGLGSLYSYSSPKVFPPNLTPVGEYLINELDINHLI